MSCGKPQFSGAGLEFSTREHATRICEKGIRIEGRLIQIARLEFDKYKFVGDPEAREGISRYLVFYNEERSHQSLNYQTPAEVYFKRVGLALRRDFGFIYIGPRNLHRVILPHLEHKEFGSRQSLTRMAPLPESGKRRSQRLGGSHCRMQMFPCGEMP